MAIFITGDTHGDFSRLLPAAFHEQRDLTNAEYLILCGDFGGVWEGGDAEQQWLDWLETRSFTTLFVSGNHENYDLLRNYPISQWHGGLVQAIRPSVLHLMRGQLYNICGKRIFTMGGASSHDIQDGILEPDAPDFLRRFQQLNAQGAAFRVNHRSWWREELPNEAEYAEARANLDRAGWTVDYILTHCAPTSIALQFSRHNVADHLTDFLQEVKDRTQYHYWLFGHYHDNKVIDTKHILLWEQIVQIL